MGINQEKRKGIKENLHSVLTNYKRLSLTEAINITRNTNENKKKTRKHG